MTEDRSKKESTNQSLVDLELTVPNDLRSRFVRIRRSWHAQLSKSKPVTDANATLKYFHSKTASFTNTEVNHAKKKKIISKQRLSTVTNTRNSVTFRLLNHSMRRLKITRRPKKIRIDKQLIK